TCWCPSITRLPLGSTCATSAAMVMLTLSLRLTLPAPTLELLDPILTRLPGFMALGRMVSTPKKLVRLAASLLVRLREVVLERSAESAIETFTVITSPTRLARGSEKKLLALGCQRGLSSWVMGGSLGMAATNLVSAGFPTGAIVGGVPIASMRSTAP